MCKITTILAVALLALAGCSTTDGEVNDAATAAPSEAPAQEAESPNPLAPADEPDTPTPTPTPTPEYGTFDGVGFTYEDGVEIIVNGLETFEPGEYSAGGEAFEQHVKFTVTITNGTAEPFDPAGAYGTISSGGQEGESVFDEGLDGTPMTAILPGKSVSWAEGYGVVDPADLVYQIAPGFDYDNALFVGGL